MNKYISIIEQQEDELFRPMKQNSRKHSLPLFIYLVLVKNSNKDKHMSQNEIIDALSKEYELDVERKAIGRVIHDLQDEHLGIFFKPREGSWYDPNGYDYDIYD